MWRSLAIAAAVYAYGHPGFDGMRPAALDRPLQSFYREVNHAARDGHRALETLDNARTMGYLKGYISRIDTKLRSAE